MQDTPVSFGHSISGGQDMDQNGYPGTNAAAAALAASHGTLFNTSRRRLLHWRPLTRRCSTSTGVGVTSPAPVPPSPPPPPINFGTRLQSPISHQCKMVPELLPHCIEYERSPRPRETLGVSKNGVSLWWGARVRNVSHRFLSRRFGYPDRLLVDKPVFHCNAKALRRVPLEFFTDLSPRNTDGPH